MVLILVCILVMVLISVVPLKFWLSARKSRKDCEKLAAPSVGKYRYEIFLNCLNDVHFLDHVYCR